MEFSNIRITDKLVKLRLSESNTRMSGAREIEGKERPSDAFAASLQALKGYVPELLGSSKEQQKAWKLLLNDDDTTVTALAIAKLKEDQVGYNISVKRPTPCSNGPLNITTPLFLRLEEDDRKDGDIFEAIDNLIAHATRYVEIVSDSQQDLFDGTPQRRPADDVKMQTVDELLAQQERDRIVAEALASILPRRPKTPATNVIALVDHLGAAFDNLEHEYEGAKYQGLFRFNDQWGFAYANLKTQLLSLHYPVPAPDAFDEAASIPALDHAAILKLATQAYWGEARNGNGKAKAAAEELAAV